jgi:hypothetical protein
MKVTGLKSDRLYNLKVSDYLINWNRAREVSRPQALVKQFLYPFWKGCVVLEEARIPASRCRIDLMNLSRRQIVEVSPSSSHSFSSFFHKNRFKFGAAVQRDLDKVAWAERNRFYYVELGDDDIANLSVKLFKELGIDL